MKELNARLKSGKTDRAYLLFGAEVFLTLAYEKRIAAAVLGDSAASGPLSEMNTTLFEGNDHDFRDIRNAAETLPFLSPLRLVIIKNSGLFQAGKKEASELMADYIPKIP